MGAYGFDEDAGKTEWDESQAAPCEQCCFKVWKHSLRVYNNIKHAPIQPLHGGSCTKRP